MIFRNSLALCYTQFIVTKLTNTTYDMMKRNRFYCVESSSSFYAEQRLVWTNSGFIFPCNWIINGFWVNHMILLNFVHRMDQRELFQITTSLHIEYQTPPTFIEQILKEIKLGIQTVSISPKWWIKIKFFSTPWKHMGGVTVQLHSFLTPALDADVWPNSGLGPVPIE